jgi:hypothetical protein
MDQQTAMKHQQMQAGHIKAGSPTRLVGAHKGGQHAEPLMQQSQATHPILGNKSEQYQQQEQFRQQNQQQQQQAPKDQVSVGGTQFGGGSKSNEYQPPLEKQKEMDKHPHNIERPKHMTYAGGIANLHEQLEGRPYHYDTNKLRGINNDHNTDNVNVGGAMSGSGDIGMKSNIKDKPTESFDDNKRDFEPRDQYEQQEFQQQQQQGKNISQRRGMDNKEGPATAPTSPINEESAPGMKGYWLIG